MVVRALAVVVFAMLTACFRAPVPMSSLKYEVKPQARCLVLLFPGAGSNQHDFEKEGFLQKLQASGLSLDVIATNATLGYYFNNSMTVRVHDDILVPAKAAKTYEKVWAIGMSMGGFGSLFYSQQRPGDIDGVFALAPYLGDKSLGEEIKEAGGLAKWQAPPAEPSTNDNYQRQLWRWLQEVTSGKTQGPVIYSGWGKEDSLGTMDKLLGDALPEGHVSLTDGAHEWAPWNLLLEQFLKDGPMAKECAAAPAAAE